MEGEGREGDCRDALGMLDFRTLGIIPRPSAFHGTCGSHSPKALMDAKSRKCALNSMWL